EALVVATESRTSSPVRIPRERETFAHPQLANLYPCAEGAGYAGGIMSAAIDGQKCVRAAVGQPTSIK
ncbi:MAG: FAD-binding protein, partial [Bacteroidota bacterium]